jgi:GxxExxY protein
MKKSLTTEATEITEEKELTGHIIGAAIEVHRLLGPGLLESAYEACLAYELSSIGLKVDRQRPLPVVYKGVTIDCGYRLDLVVEDRVVCELKTVDRLAGIHQAQILSYLRLSGIRIGLLINFHEAVLRTGIKRFTTKPLPPSPL